MTERIEISPNPDRALNSTYFGACPHCRMTDGYMNDGPDHYDYCAVHKVKWGFGSNLFSGWRHETPEQRSQQRLLLALLDGVEPVFPEREDAQFVVELATTNVLMRWPCHVCGGVTEKDPVLAEVLLGPQKGFRVCNRCLNAGDIDARLAAHAEELEMEADQLRQMIGRLQVPTYEAWRAMWDRVDTATWADCTGAHSYDDVMENDGIHAAARQARVNGRLAKWEGQHRPNGLDENPF